MIKKFFILLIVCMMSSMHTAIADTASAFIPKKIAAADVYTANPFLSKNYAKIWKRGKNFFMMIKIKAGAVKTVVKIS